MADLVTIAVEGGTDEVICRRLLFDAKIDIAAVYGLKGKAYLDTKVHSYNAAARHAPWIVMRDLDSDEPCAPDLIHRLLPSPAPMMRLQIAVRTAEAWLLADAESLSAFMGIRVGAIPRDPEGLTHPKTSLVELARASRKRSIRDGIIPAQGSTAKVGPGYTACISEFATTYWDPRAAASHSASLSRFLNFLQALKARS
jgi:hypothetical protein